MKNLSKFDRFDIYSPDWLLRCVESQRLMPAEPHEIVYATPTTQEQLRALVDDFGDSYETPADYAMLSRALDKVRRPAPHVRLMTAF